MNVSYRLVRPITSQHNNPSAKLQRQLAASYFIRNMIRGKRIINVDESVIRQTDHRKRGWIAREKHNMVVQSSRLNCVNIIAGISSYGEFFFTVNQGKTNGITFLYFLTKLISELDSIDSEWRRNTVIMVDNAPYHRC